MKAKKFFLSTVGMCLLAGGILTGCGETQVEDVSSDNEAQAEGEKTTEEETEEKVYSVGDTVKVNDLEITLKDASFTDPAEYSPSENGKILTINIATNNTGEESTYIDSTEFNIYDPEGNQLSEYYGYDELSISGDVNSEKKLAGKLYYDVPEAESYELIYKPSFSWDDKEITFNIKPE